MGSKRYNWLSKIWASTAHTSIQNQNFYHMWNWISHFGLKKQFTRGERLDGGGGLADWSAGKQVASEAGSITKHQLWWMSFRPRLMLASGNRAPPVPSHIWLQGENEGTNSVKERNHNEARQHPYISKSRPAVDWCCLSSACVISQLCPAWQLW